MDFEIINSIEDHLQKSDHPTITKTQKMIFPNPLVFRKPSWQLRACFASVLVTPVLYRFYLIMVTIGYVLFSSIKPCQVFSCELSTLDNNYALLKATPKLYVSRVYTVSVLIIEPASVRTPSFVTPIIILHVQNFFVYCVSRKIIGSIIRTIYGINFCRMQISKQLVIKVRGQIGHVM